MKHENKSAAKSKLAFRSCATTTTSLKKSNNPLNIFLLIVTFNEKLLKLTLCGLNHVFIFFAGGTYHEQIPLISVNIPLRSTIHTIFYVH